MPTTARLIAHPSDGLWKSMAVKACRIGWADGLKAMYETQGREVTKYVLHRQIWEDVVPSMEEVAEVVRAASEVDIEAYCAFDTFHGKGLGEEYCDLDARAERITDDRREMEGCYAAARTLGLWIPPRVMNCFWMWLQVRDHVPSGRREVDKTPFRGIPAWAADVHTREGRFLGQRVTLLSGTSDQHRQLARMVQKGGWKHVRELAHTEPLITEYVRPPQQGQLFE